MQTLKYLLTSLLVMILVVVFFVGSLIFLVKFNNKSDFAQFIKDKTLTYPGFVTLINLNEPGDNKYTYFSPNYQTLRVNVFFQKNMEPDTDFNSWVKEIVAQTIGKEINYKTNILSGDVYADSYTNKRLNYIRDIVNSTVNPEPYLNIVFLTTYQDQPRSVGVVVHRDTIFMFKKSLNKLSDKLLIKKELEKSTFMHEWAHLLGLNHLEEDNCIMNQKVEVYDQTTVSQDVDTRYCQTELNYFGQMKLGLKPDIVIEQ